MATLKHRPRRGTTLPTTNCLSSAGEWGGGGYEWNVAALLVAILHPREMDSETAFHVLESGKMNRKNAPAWGEEELAQALRMQREGRSLSQIGQAMGINANTLFNRLRKAKGA